MMNKLKSKLFFSLKMNVNWIFGLLVCAVGNTVVPPPPPDTDDEYLYHCPEPGCTRRFMTRGGRNKHLRQHAQNVRRACQHGCGKSYATGSNQALKLHERTCERNPAG